jgi:hypothetical protein
MKDIPQDAEEAYNSGLELDANPFKEGTPSCKIWGNAWKMLNGEPTHCSDYINDRTGSPPDLIESLEASGLKPIVIDENFDFNSLDKLIEP